MEYYTFLSISIRHVVAITVDNARSPVKCMSTNVEGVPAISRILPQEIRTKASSKRRRSYSSPSSSFFSSTSDETCKAVVRRYIERNVSPTTTAATAVSTCGAASRWSCRTENTVVEVSIEPPKRRSSHHCMMDTSPKIPVRNVLVLSSNSLQQLARRNPSAVTSSLITTETNTSRSSEGRFGRGTMMKSISVEAIQAVMDTLQVLDYDDDNDTDLHNDNDNDNDNDEHDDHNSRSNSRITPCAYSIYQSRRKSIKQDPVVQVQVQALSANE